MAYDKKRLQTFRELERLSNPFRYLKGGYSPYDGAIYARYGRFYATNGFVMACCEWPELSHFGDGEWQEITRYVDDDGLLLAEPESVSYFVKYYRQLDSNHFDKFYFVKGSPETFAFNPKLMRDALKIFEINNINPIWSANGTFFMFTGHNSDVSIKVLMMGCH